MKKICFFIGNLNLTGGTERVTSVLSNILSEKGYQVSILSIFEGLSPNFEISNNIKLYQLFSRKVSMKFNFFNSIVRIRKFVIEHEIETFIVVDSISCIFTAPALVGLKVNHVCWEHFNFKFNAGSKFRGFGRKIATVMCDYIVTLTNIDRENWQNYYKKNNDKIITIYNPSPYTIQESNPALDSKVVLYVGRLSKEKGVDLLLEAWAKVTKKNFDWCLKIVGTGSEEENLKKQCQFLGIEDSVCFEGECKTLMPYYREAKFLCLPSRDEGFGMVIIEAYSFGLPVLAFNIETGPKELIENNTGFLAEPYNIDEFSNNILKLINMKKNVYVEMSLECKEKVKIFQAKETFLKWHEILSVNK